MSFLSPLPLLGRLSSVSCHPVLVVGWPGTSVALAWRDACGARFGGLFLAAGVTWAGEHGDRLGKRGLGRWC